MPSFDWNEEKNQQLKRERNVSFEMVIIAIKEGRLLETTRSKNKQYQNQLYYVVEIGNYAYIVPFVIDTKRNIYFLKTIYPSRKATKKYLKK